MNRFELFTMIFYALDLYYDENPSEELGRFLGMMSPFTFEEVDSADSAVFADFCDFVKCESVSIQDSYDVAVNYLKSIEGIDLFDIFSSLTRDSWMKGCEEYLSKPHKGQSQG